MLAANSSEWQVECEQIDVLFGLKGGGFAAR